MNIWLRVHHPLLQDMMYGIGGIVNFGFELTGRGIKEDPFKIARLHEFYESGISLHFKDSIDPLEIDGFTLASIHLENCENASILNVKLRGLELKKCFSILIQNASVKKKTITASCKK